MGGSLEINFNEEKSGSGSVTYSKTPIDFLSNSKYNLPKYSVWNSGTVKGQAKRTTAFSKGTIAITIGNITVLDKEKVVENDYATYSQDFTTEIGSVFINNSDGYLTLNGNIEWKVSSSTINYIKDQTIILNYDYPKFTISTIGKDLKGNSKGGTVSGANTIEITEKGQQKTLTLTASPASGYFFIGWEDDESIGPTRTLTLNESELTSPNTQITYTALFVPKELYVGTKNVTAAYVGSKKAKVYRGTTRIL